MFGGFQLTIPTCCPNQRASYATYLQSIYYDSDPAVRNNQIGRNLVSVYGKVGFTFGSIGYDVDCRSDSGNCNSDFDNGSTASYKLCLLNTTSLSPGFYTGRAGSSQEIHDINVPNVCGC